MSEQTEQLVGVTSENSGAIENEDAKLIGSVVTKMLNGSYTREEIRRFDNRQNPFVLSRLSKNQREVWEKLYRDECGLTVDLSQVTVPDNPGGLDRILVIAERQLVQSAECERQPACPCRSFRKALARREGFLMQIFYPAIRHF